MGVRISVFLTVACSASAHALGSTPAEVCESLGNGAWPGIKCFMPAGKPIAKAGSFGALIAVELKNDGKHFDVYVNCPLHPDYAKDDYKGIEVQCGPEDFVDPKQRSSILIFWKNAKEELMMAEEYMAAHHFQVGPLRKEVIRGRLIARAGVGPDVFEVTMPGNVSARHPIMEDSTTAELLPFTTFGDSTRAMGQQASRIVRRGVESITRVSASPSLLDGDLQEAFDRHLMTVAWTQATSLGMLWSRSVWAYKLFARGYLHCDAHTGNVMMPKFDLNLANETERRALDKMIKKGLVYVKNFADIPTMPLEIDSETESVPLEIAFVQPVHWLMIDPAYIITLRNLVIDKKIPMRDVVNPCLVQRQARVEDAVHLWHVVLRRLDGLAAVKKSPTHDTDVLRDKLRNLGAGDLVTNFEKQMMEFSNIMRHQDLMLYGLQIDGVVNCGAQGLEYFRKIQHRGRLDVNVTREVYKHELYDDMPFCSAADYIRLAYTLVKYLAAQAHKIRQTSGWRMLEERHKFQILEISHDLSNEKVDLSKLVRLDDIDNLLANA